MEKLAWFLDKSIPVPGTRFRFGVEPILGLIPVAGDVLGIVLGAAILYETIRVGAPRSLVTRMIGNSAADALLGLVPVAGDLFDFAFKSNHRNAKLLMEHIDRLESAARPKPKSSPLVAVLVVSMAVAATSAIVLLAWKAVFG